MRNLTGPAPGPPPPRDGEAGQTMVEYTVVLAVITAAIVASIAALSGEIDSMYGRIVGFL
jgi:Flp pilus assembly pilin Flp